MCISQDKPSCHGRVQFWRQFLTQLPQHVTEKKKCKHTPTCKGSPFLPRLQLTELLAPAAVNSGKNTLGHNVIFLRKPQRQRDLYSVLLLFFKVGGTCLDFTLRSHFCHMCFTLSWQFSGCGGSPTVRGQQNRLPHLVRQAWKLV